MSIKVAINGFGRIGRNILRAKYESSRYDDIEIVAINDLGDCSINAHLLEYDTAHGKFKMDINTYENEIVINQVDKIKVFSERNPENLPWGDLDVDVVHECTGFFASKEASLAHIKSGAKRVIISAPAKNVDATIVYGVNHHILNDDHIVISNASCTTNCLATLIRMCMMNLQLLMD